MRKLIDAIMEASGKFCEDDRVHAADLTIGGWYDLSQ